MKIVSYKSFGPIKFGMAEDEVIQQLVKPNSICTGYNGRLEYTYDEFEILFDASKLVSEVTIYPKEHGVLQINDLQLNWQGDFYIDLCLEDTAPYYEFTTIVLFNLGIVIRGYQDNEDADRCIGVFSKENYDSLMKGTIPLKISRIKNLQKRKLYLINIFSYVVDLYGKAQEQKEVMPSDLTSVETAAAIQVAREDISKLAVKKFEIDFSEIKRLRFNDYIKKLYTVNNKQIYIWNFQTEACGSYKLDSIKSINLNSFYIDDRSRNHNIWEFISVDFKDRLTLSFNIDDFTGKEMLKIKVQGINWPSVKY